MQCMRCAAGFWLTKRGWAQHAEGGGGSGPRTEPAAPQVYEAGAGKPGHERSQRWHAALVPGRVQAGAAAMASIAGKGATVPTLWSVL
jgi:hypothetical protein